MPRQAGHDIRASGQAKPGRCGAASERPHREGDGRLGGNALMLYEKEVPARWRA